MMQQAPSVPPKTRSFKSAAAGRKPKSPPQTLETWVMESAGSHKYAVQVRKAGNGNPCIRLVEGVPQDDGTYRKFNLTIWSEDFERFFTVMDQMREYIKTNKIATPPGHKYRPAPKKGAA